MLKTLTWKPETPFNVLSLDSEADEAGITYVWCVWGHYKGHTVDRRFIEPSKVVKFLFKRRWIHTILTGVNLDFDLNTLKYKGGFNWDCHYNMGSLIFCTPPKKEKKKLDGKAIHIIELGNWVLNTSLQKMCSMFGIKGHIDLHILDRDRGNIKEMEEACRSHAVCGALCFEYLQDQFHEIGGRMRVTMSASAMDIFRRHFLNENHQIYDYVGNEPKFFGLSDDATKKEIETARLEKISKMKQDTAMSYYGARTECFRKGVFWDVDVIDRNSSYPAEMIKIILPDHNRPRNYPKTKQGLTDALESSEGCAFVNIACPENLLIPLLPVRNAKNNRLEFVSGQFDGWYTFIELRAALDNGYKINIIYEIYAFAPLEGFFTDYINHMYSMKLDKKTKIVGKLGMNGLSGKFGQQKPDDSGYLLYDGNDINILDNNNFFYYRGLVWEYVAKDSEMEKEFVSTAYPLISAYILAGARVDLWHKMKAIGFKHILYCDTDSIYVAHEYLQAAVDRGDIEIDDKKLGAWAVEGLRGRMEIRGLKYYLYSSFTDDAGNKNTKFVIKGVNGASQRRYWMNRSATLIRARKIRTSIRKGEPVNQFIPIFKRDRVVDDKRLFDNKGMSKPKTLFN